MYAHLWTDEDPPEEYIEMVLCRDVYHCRPSELDQEDMTRISAHLICLDVENEYRRRKQEEANE